VDFSTNKPLNNRSLALHVTRLQGWSSFSAELDAPKKVKMANVNKQNTCNTLFLQPGAGRMGPGVSIMVRLGE
jgi:hypothetical protein